MPGCFLESRLLLARLIWNLSDDLNLNHFRSPRLHPKAASLAAVQILPEDRAEKERLKGDWATRLLQENCSAQAEAACSAEQHFAARAATSGVELLWAAHAPVGDSIALVVLACHKFSSYLTPHDANPLYRISEKSLYLLIPEKSITSR